MTPTREQLAEEIEEIAGQLWRDLCEGDGQHSEALDKSLIRKHMHRLAAACLAAPPQATPEPTIAARVRMAAERGCVYNVLVSRICERGTSGCDIDHKAAAPEPQAMPPIEPDDWVELEQWPNCEWVVLSVDSDGRVSLIGLDLRYQIRDVIGISKANGTVWTREPRR